MVGEIPHLQRLEELSPAKKKYSTPIIVLASVLKEVPTTLFQMLKDVCILI